MENKFDFSNPEDFRRAERLAELIILNSELLIALTAVHAVGLMTNDETFIKTNLEKLEALK